MQIKTTALVINKTNSNLNLINENILGNIYQDSPNWVWDLNEWLSDEPSADF